MKTKTEIKEIRERLQLTQKEVGQRLGVSTRTIMRWEKGEGEPRPGDLELARTWKAKKAKKRGA